MRVNRLGLLAIALSGAAACSGDSNGVTTTPPPLAYVRYVQAMPDTGQVDVRFVDKVENFPALAFGYRSVTPYQGIVAGSRQMRVFPTSTDPAVASQVILDTTLTFTAGTYYTILHTGYARTGQAPKQHFVVLQDAVPAPSGTQVAIRAVVATPGIGPVDVYTTAATGDPLPAAPTFTGIDYGAAAAWLNFTPGAMALKVTAAGNTTVLGQAAAPAGDTAKAYLDPIAGTKIGGSALSAFIFAPGVAGSANAALTAAGVTYSVDKRPPRP